MREKGVLEKIAPKEGTKEEEAKLYKVYETSCKLFIHVHAKHDLTHSIRETYTSVLLYNCKLTEAKIRAHISDP